jgi:hypothetical protein
MKITTKIKLGGVLVAVLYTIIFFAIETNSVPHAQAVVRTLLTALVNRV